jgi:hypothetical protein
MAGRGPRPRLRARFQQICGVLDRGGLRLGASALILAGLVAFLTGGPAWGQTEPGPGGSGHALRFYGNGVNDIDRVKIPIDNPEGPADVGATDFTLEFWMKAFAPDNPSAACFTGSRNWINGNIMFDRDVFGDGDFGDYGVSLFGGKIAFGVHNGSSGAGICSTQNVADGVWHHIAVTRSRSTGQISIFVDGLLDAEGAGPLGDLSYRNNRPTIWPNDPYLVIGAEKHDAGFSFPSYSGWIDEVRLSTLLRYTVSFPRPSDPFVTDSNTVALYHFDEGSGDLIADSSGAAGGPSDGVRKLGGTPAGPEWVNDTPFSMLPDISPPVRANGRPSGTLAAGTAVATLSLMTNENATCRYSASAGVLYGSMTNFAATGGTSHSTLVAGLVDGESYTYYVRCQDAALNANPDDFAIAFSVASAPAGGLLAAYGFDEGSGATTADASGNNRTATIAGATWTTHTTGGFGRALLFDGVNDRVTTAGTVTLGPPFTLMAWVFNPRNARRPRRP